MADKDTQLELEVYTRTTSRYADLSRLPGPTGSSIQRQMATIKARLIARYRLHTVPGRPEELTQQTLHVEFSDPNYENRTYVGKTVSLGYGCGGIRIRKHDDRRWIDCLDLQPNDGWHAQVYAYLDPFFGYVEDTAQVVAAKQAITDAWPSTASRRPIRDNPQA